MENPDFMEPRPIEIPNNFSEKDLILMFPFSYATYRVVIMATQYNVFIDEKEPEQDFSTGTLIEKWLETFKNFLETVGPAPEDTEMAH